MYSSKGFSLVELMIVVGIIGILTAIGLPTYRNYILRVRIAEAINDITILARDAQIAFGDGSLRTAVDLEQLAKNAELTLYDIAGCTDGFQKSLIEIPKDKLSYIGITSPYIRYVMLFGQTSKPCTDINSRLHDDSIDIMVHLDTEALGVPNKSGDKDYNSIQMSVSQEVIYEDLKGNITRREAGSVLSCGIYPRGADFSESEGDLSKFDFPISALPPMCRYFRVAGSTPRKLVELSAY